MSLAALASAAVLFASSFRLAGAVTAQTFEPPSKGPLVQTANYTSFSNNTLHNKHVVKGKAFNRIIQVWLENTDFEVCAYTLCISTASIQLPLDRRVDSHLRIARGAGDTIDQL
jgi:hypothetical protein